MRKVHLVIPCYRESARLGDFLPGLCTEMDRLGGVQVLVVEDGSGPEEQRKIQDLLTGWRAQYACLSEPLLLKDNVGKGGAVYSGWAEAAAGTSWLGFVDADGACPVSAVLRLIDLARQQTACERALFASRVKMLGRQVHRLLKRHLLGRLYATLVSEILDIPVYDSQCGLKLIPRERYLEVEKSLQIRRFAFDVELMVALLDRGCEIEEVPIDWTEIPGGKVNLIRDSWRMAWDVWGIQSRREGRKP